MSAALRPEVVLLLADCENLGATFARREHPRHPTAERGTPGEPFATADAELLLSATGAEIAAAIEMLGTDIALDRAEIAPLRNKAAEIARRQLRRLLDPATRLELTEWLRDHGGGAA